jgi:hypothetical protein
MILLIRFNCLRRFNQFRLLKEGILMKINVPFPMIYLPKYMTMEPETKLGFYGEFHVIKKRHGIITQELKFRNVITDIGLKYLAGNLPCLITALNLCQLGKGSTTPTSSDTELETYGTYKQYSAADWGLGLTNDRYCKVQFEFGLTDVIGSWTELGLSWTSGSGSNVFCRMLFKDDNGNATTITKTSDDTMTIIYYLHVVRSSDTPTENTITIDNVNYTVQSLVTDSCLYSISDNGSPDQINILGNTARLGTGTDALNTTQKACRTPINTSPSLYSVVPYVSDAFYREFIFEFPASITGNIAEFVFPENFYYMGGYQTGWIAMRFPTPISKTDTTKKIRLQPRITFGRAA